MPITQSDRFQRGLERQGLTPEEVSMAMRAEGFNVEVAQANPTQEATDLGQARDDWEESGITQWIKSQGLPVPELEEMLDTVGQGLGRVASLRQGMSAIKDAVTGRASVATRQTGNFLELLLGASEPLWRRPQQTFFGWVAGDDADELRAIMLPEVYADVPESDSMFMSSVEQLSKLLKAGATGNLDRVNELLDREPNVFESMHEDRDFRDVVIDKAFQGDQDSFNNWLMDIQTSQGGNLKLATMATTQGFVEIFADPAFAVDFAPSAIRVGKQGVRALKLGSIEAARLEQLDKLVAKVSDPVTRTLPDALEAQKLTGDRLTKAKEASAKNPGDVESLRKQVQAEKRNAEANLAVNRQKQGPKTDVTFFRKMPRRKAERVATARSIKTRGRTTEQVRRDLEASILASPSEIGDELKKIGFKSEAGFGKAIEQASEKAIQGDAGALEALNKWSALPENVQQALDIKGISVPKIVRREALRAADLDPAPFSLVAEDAAQMNQRAILGPPDWEAAGDAARRLVEGADLGDVTMYGTALPEYDIISKTATGPSGPDGQWVREILDSRKVESVTLGSGAEAKVFKETDQYQLLLDRGMPGLLERSKLPNLMRVVGSGTFPFREPRGALRGTGIFERWRAGALNFEIEYHANVEKFANWLKEAGVAKRTIWQTFRVTDEDGAGRIFDLLDAEPRSEQFGKLWDAAPDGQRQAFTNVRKWLDEMADRQGLPQEMRISGYARHLFPESIFKDGARPVEFVGLPATAEVSGSHLLPRLGKTGYQRNLLEMLENYNRASLRKVHMEPTYQDMLDLGAQRGGHIQKYTDDFVHEAKGMPSTLDTLADRAEDMMAAAMGKTWKLPRASRAGMAISSLYYSAMLAGNLNYLIQNIGTGILNPLSKFGALNTAEGMLRMATKEGRDMARASGVARQHERLFEGPMQEFAKFMAKAGPEQSEFYVRGLSFHAALSNITKRSGKTWSQLVEEGLDQRALWEAVNSAEEVQHIYGFGGRSPFVGRHIGGTARTVGSQFLSFPFKQTGFLLALAKEDPGLVMRYFAYSGIMQRIVADQLNIDANDFTGLGYFPAPRADRPIALAPGMELIASWMDVTAAANIGDDAEFERALSRFYDNALSAVPVLGPIRKSAEAAKRLNDGEVTRVIPGTGGAEEKVRPIEFPEEILPTLLQTRSIQERGQREIDEQHRENVRNELFLRRQLAKEYTKAFNTGDFSAVAQIQQALAEQGIFVSGNPAQGNLEAMYMDRNLRLLMKNPLFMPPGFIPGGANEPSP